MKAKLVAVFIGLFMLVPFSVPVFAQTVQQEINNNLCAGSNFELSGNAKSCSNLGGASNNLDTFIKHMVNILSAVIGVVAVVMIMVGGFRYVTSGGNDSSVTSAKNTILYAIIGLIIVALSQVLVHFTIKNLTG